MVRCVVRVQMLVWEDEGEMLGFGAMEFLASDEPTARDDRGILSESV